MATESSRVEAARPTVPPIAAAELTRHILSDLFGPPERRGFAVRLWDGSLETQSPTQPPRFTLVLRHPGALRRMLLFPTHRALGEAYLRNDFDIEGDLAAATALAETLAELRANPGALFRLAALLRRLPYSDAAGAAEVRGHTGRWRLGGKHSRTRDRAAIRYHYDVGNDFYRLFLDRRMVYSCGYFPTDTADLDAAQEAKLELICRKLRLREGEHLLDIGCGWGGLILYAAERHGVHATGITLSEAQATLARERIAAAGLADRCRVEVRDYRDLPADTRFDKIASVGMVEHVGRAKLPDYFREVYRLLRPGGLFLNHGIVSLEPPRSALRRLARRPLRRWSSFMENYVFPDGELLASAENLTPAEAAGFEVRDVESLREHYAETLRHWVRRLEVRHDDAVALVGEPTYRVWRLYMAGCAHAFATARVGVIQALLARPDERGAVRLPRTRADLYASGNGSPCTAPRSPEDPTDPGAEHHE